MVRRLVDRFVAGLVLLVLRAFFRSVEVAGRERIPQGRPLLIVANHFYGLVDAVMLVHVLGRLPRFLAKAALWQVRAARPLLAFAGILPVHARDDGADAANREVFALTHQVLRRNGMVALFPEGITHDEPSLAPIRTGAARIALGARAAGVRGLVILPVGLAFDDKLALRSRALARVGTPIDLDTELAAFVDPGSPETEDNRAAVRRLTDEIEARLREVSPDFTDVRQAAVLSRAAEIAIRTRADRQHAPVPLAEQQELAQCLAYAEPEALSELTDALARYHLNLEVFGLRDHQVFPGYHPRAVLAGFATTAAVVAALAPLALVGAVVNLLPYWCVQAAGRMVHAPVTKGTVRFLFAVPVFPLVWLAAGWAVGLRGVGLAAVVVVVFPVTGLAAVAAFERVIRARRAWRGWQGLRERRALLDEVTADRERLVEAVAKAAAAAPHGPPRAPAGAWPAARERMGWPPTGNRGGVS